MRVLIAPDSFTGTLSAPDAARAIADGWLQTAPSDSVTLAPMADGGPGFIDVVNSARGGELHATMVRGPLGEPTPATVLRVGDTAYVESAQACGLALTPEPAPWQASSYGVGELVAAALDTGASTVVVGLGGSATNDGGAGLLGALGAAANVPLDAGPESLRELASIDVRAAQTRCNSARIVIASDVDSPLLGMFGATKTFGPQKGLSDTDIITVDGILDAFVVAACGPTPAERRMADSPGAGAAGGLGFALMLLGGTRTSGIDLVTEAVGLQALAAHHDLVITGEGIYDFSSRAGKVVYGVGAVAAAAARPCIVLAGQVSVGAREMRAMGVQSAYSASELINAEASIREPAVTLAALAARVARTWSPQTSG